MMKRKIKPAAATKTIDGYLAALNPQQRAALEKLRKAIRSAAPKAKECISYGVPAFRRYGEVVELRCTYDPATRGGDSPDGRKPKATLHWLSAANAVLAEVRLYDYLFTRPDPGADGDLFADVNPASETVLQGCMLEPALAATPIGETVQFERLGYFCPDLDSSPERLVFNRTLTLKDGWAKAQARG